MVIQHFASASGTNFVLRTVRSTVLNTKFGFSSAQSAVNSGCFKEYSQDGEGSNATRTKCSGDLNISADCFETIGTIESKVQCLTKLQNPLKRDLHPIEIVIEFVSQILDRPFQQAKIHQHLQFNFRDW